MDPQNQQPGQTPNLNPIPTQPLPVTPLQPNLTPSQTPQTPQTPNPAGSGKLIAVIALLLIILIAVIGFITIKLYFPNLLNPQKSTAVPASSTPSATIAVSAQNSPSPKPTLDPVTKEAFENSGKIMSYVDINDSAVLVSGLIYAYRGKITKIEKDADGWITLTTEKSVTGLPNTWKYNQMVGTFKLPEFSLANSTDLKVGSKILVTGAFIYKTQNKFQKAGDFNLLSVGILPDEVNLTTIRNPLSKKSSQSPDPTISTQIEITDSQLKSDFEKARKVMSQIDLTDPSLDTSGLIYSYAGTVSKLDKDAEGWITFSTDKTVTGIPNTWKYNKMVGTYIRKADNTIGKIDDSLLKVGDKVRVFGAFVVNGYEGWEIPNEWELTSVSVDN